MRLLGSCPHPDMFVKPVVLPTGRTSPVVSMAVDPVSGLVFVPFGAVAGNNLCPNGCMGVFADVTAVPEPDSYAMMLAGLGLMGLAVTRRKRKAA